MLALALFIGEICSNCFSKTFRKESSTDKESLAVPVESVAVESEAARSPILFFWSATHAWLTSSMDPPYSFSSRTSQNCSLATPWSKLRTRSWLSAPGSSIWILPEPAIRWMLGWEVPKRSIRVLKMLKERSMAFSTSVSIISRISASVDSKEILPRFAAVANTALNALPGLFFCHAA